MGLQIPISTSFNLPDGREVVIETGKLAAQANGSVLVKMGDTMLLATVVSNKEPKVDLDYFPLSVDYQEKFAAAGRIPGNFFRREGRLSDYEILISRLVDRAIRPLFPENYVNETQIVLILLSGDKNVRPDALAALAASSALAVSDIPFLGPISEVRVARVNGEYLVNPNADVMAGAELDIIVGATMDSVTMVEGEGNEVSEHHLVEAIRVAHDAIKVQIQAQLDLAKKVGDKALTKREVTPFPENEELKARVEAHCRDKFTEISTSRADKQVRKKAFDETVKELLEQIQLEKGEEYITENAKIFKRYVEDLRYHIMRDLVLSTGVRLDGRSSTDIRPIWSEVDYLPAAHGSAVFTRGETQSITTATLGTKMDELLMDNALNMYNEKFILHYNFPPYSVGEVKPLRAPGRREVGHANLAARSLRKIMPTEFPYTVRVVSDILESNGSSSMATVCAGSLALMDCGVPTKAPIAGIAMGLIKENERVAILSDILGDEDALGDMDFKVTGTEKGITGCQMDIKIEGLPYDLLERALEQARVGRLHILSKMNETMATPREDFKPHAPRIVEIIIEKSFIGAVIGPGGKVIQEIQAVTGTTINIEEVGDKGVVNIASANKEAIDAAVQWVNRITFSPEVGDVYEAVVKSVMPYGVFVEFNGKSGLLHVSEFSHSKIDKVEDVFSEGDMVKVKLIEIDRRTGKYRLSRKALMPRPERSGKGGEDEDSGHEQGGERQERSDRDYRGGNRDHRGGRDGHHRDRDRGGDHHDRNKDHRR